MTSCSCYCVCITHIFVRAPVDEVCRRLRSFLAFTGHWLPSHLTADQTPTNADQLNGLVRRRRVSPTAQPPLTSEILFQWGAVLGAIIKDNSPLNGLTSRTTVGYDRVKTDLIEECVHSRSTPHAVYAVCPLLVHPTLKARSSRPIPSFRLSSIRSASIPDASTLTTLNRRPLNPQSVCSISAPCLK